MEPGAKAERLAGHAFLSYARDDSSQVDGLQSELEAAGVKVWRDTAELWPGQDWRAEIREAITGNAVVFIACFSSRSVAREASYQNEELLLAIEQLRLRQPGHPWFIPVRFDDCHVPDLELGGGRTLASIQRVDLFGPDRRAAIRRLVSVVTWHLGEQTPTMHPPDSVADEAAPAPAGPTQNDLDRAERIARSIAVGFWKVVGLSDVAVALAVVDRSRAIRILSDAERVGRSITDKDARVSALSRVAEGLADIDPGRSTDLFSEAERVAHSIYREYPRISALSRVAVRLAASAPARAAAILVGAERVAGSIAEGYWKASALTRVATALVGIDLGRVARVLADAERAARSAGPDESYLLIDVAEALVAADPDQAERVANSIIDKQAEALAVCRVAKALAATHPGRAARLLADAEGAANSMVDEDQKGSVLSEVSEMLAVTDPDRAEYVANSILGEDVRAVALCRVSKALAAADHGRAARILADAELVAGFVSDRDKKVRVRSYLAEARGRLAEVLAPSDTGRAERMARSIADSEAKASALTGIVSTLVRTSA